MDTIDRAVVIGGSIAGLATAATLSPRVHEVLVLERRHAAADRSIAAQGALPHVMLAAGNRVLESLFPGFAQDLLDHGARGGGADPTRVPCHWVAADRVRDHLSLPDLGFPRALCSRHLVESRLRAATLTLPNVTLLDAAAEGLAVTGYGAGSRATGVRLQGHPRPLEADLVVDASGRASRVQDWLAAAGLGRPVTTQVFVDLRYAGFVVERRPDDFAGATFAVVQNTPSRPRIGVALPMEADRWQIALGGYFGEAPPTDPAGARAFAESLADPALGELLSRPHLAGPSRYAFRSSLRRHWERLADLPSGLCAVGDSVASFNPIYGQGMTSALLQAEALGQALDLHESSSVMRRVARVVDGPWLSSTGGDFVYPETRGRRAPGTDLVNRYVERVTRAAAVDESVNATFTEVQQLLATPSALFRPAVMARAIRLGGPERLTHPQPARPAVAS